MRKANPALAGLLVGAVLGCGQPDDTALEERQAAVAEAGAEVMPFDLDRTTHVFEANETGGVQQVVSRDDDPEQVRLIRAHLSEEAERFRRGDFHDPEMIHGSEMPGLHALVAGHERVSLEYTEIDGGAQIVYETGDEELVQAIHRWFEAQLTDHGDHAQPHAGH